MNVRLPHLFGYSVGECANSLIMNGLFGFAMLYYTDALGLPAHLAGMAMSVSVFWEALSDPLMGHLSDRTRHRWGRRLPWMMAGGLLMAVFFYFVWAVPGGLHGQPTALFWYLVVMNLLLRTGLTMFFIPYMALGFELTGDDRQRTILQSLRQVFNMAANFAGPAMAWSLFFRDVPGATPDAPVVKGTAIAGNYLAMGGAFSIATLVAVAVVLAACWNRREDTRGAIVPAHPLRSFRDEMLGILADPRPRWVLVFIAVVATGMVLVSSLQMYVYVHFMQFSAAQKSIAHGSTMIGMALGALLAIPLVRRLDKRGAVLVGGVVSVAANLGLGVVFLGGLLPTGVAGEGASSTSLAAFVALHATYWLGNGILLPVSTAMMADAAELHRLRTGQNRDGGYAAVFSLALRLAISFSLLLSGWILDDIGFKAGHDQVQTPATIHALGLVMFVAGSVVAAAALAAIARYRTDQATLEAARRHAVAP